MRLRELPEAQELSTDWGDMIMDYISLIESLKELEASLQAGDQTELSISYRISKLLDEEVTG